MDSDEQGRKDSITGMPLTRRQVLKGAAVVGGAFALGPIISACGGGSSGASTSPSPSASAVAKNGGSLKVGIVGGSAKDTADVQKSSFEPDIAICYNMYDGLMGASTSAQVELHLADEVTPNADGSVWTVRLKPGLTWHDGKPVTADDVVYSFDRVLDPKDPKTGVAILSGLKVGGTKKVDNLTVQFNLDPPNVIFKEALAFRGNQIVPQGFDAMLKARKPIGCGPFKLTSFLPGQQFTFAPFDQFWAGKPHVDELTIIEFADDTARVNALVSGQVQVISELPNSQVPVIEGTSGLAVANAETGAWRPFCLRIDVKPYSDVRVRQAFRLIVDRPAMITQAYNGFGAVGNDMYARYDPGTPNLPQRHQDLEQAKSLLKQAGYADLTVELVTSSGALGAAEVAAAQVFAEQAKGAGVQVKLNQVDASIFYGKQYLTWPFSQDFWYARNYLQQAGQATMPGAPYNECHWKNDKWLAIVREAYRTVDETKRNQLIGEAQTIEYNEGGYIIWAFRNQVDAYSKKIAGLPLDKLGVPLGQFGFKSVYFT